MNARTAVLAIVIASLASPAFAGGGRIQVIDDEHKTGKLYTAETYKNCDISKVKATVQSGELKVKTTFRGKLTGGSLRLNLSIGKSKKGAPDYFVDASGSGDEGFITKTGGVDEFGNPKDGESLKGKASVKAKKGGKDITIDVPLKHIGKPKRTGFQVQTCGEGAVDLAPGKNHVDDTKYQGRPDYQFAVIKTGG